jgi:glycosyl transferase family 25
MKVFVINVDKDNKRMESLHEHLIEHEIEYERISAETGPTEEFGSLKYVCNKGVAGSFASHRKCWRRIIDEDLEMAMILEDDARFTDEASTILKKVLSELPDDFDILYLGCSGIGDEEVNFLKNPHHIFLLPNIMTRKKSKKVSENLVVPASPFQIHAYILSNKGAKTLLSKKPVTCFGDYDLSIFQDLHMYACKPQIATQSEKFNSHQAQGNFPYLLSKFVEDLEPINTQYYRILGTIIISPITIGLGIAVSFFPELFILLLPDLYYSMEHVVSVLAIMFVIKSMTSLINVS